MMATTPTRVPLLLCCLSVVFTLFGTSQGALAGLAGSQWPMFRHDLSHSGVSQYHDAVPGGAAWKFDTGEVILSSCAIAPGGTIYVGSNYNLFALNSDGTLKWQRDIASSSVRSSPAVADDGTVHVGSLNGTLYAIRADGTVRWTYPTGNQITSSPAIAPNGNVVFASRDGYLYCLRSNGSHRWDYLIGNTHMCSPAIGADGTIYIGSGSRYLYAIDSGGSENWRYPTDDTIWSSPALSPDGSAVYFGCCDMYLHAVNTSDGSGLWTFPMYFLNQSTSASPAVAPDGTIYIGSNLGIFYAISPAGTEIWRYETGSDIRSSAAISADGTIYFGSMDGFLTALNPDGTLKWRYLTRDGVYASPAIAADGSVCVGSFDLYVYGNLNSTPPAANPPTDLQATILSETSVRLNWTDNSSDEYGFRVERKTGAAGAYEVVAAVAADITTFMDITVVTGQTYYYRVAAYQEGGFSYSNEVEVNMPGLPVPTNLAATTVSETRIDLTWVDNAQSEEGYKIERKAGNLGFFREIATVYSDFMSNNPCAYSDTSVNPATDYYYRVRGFNAGGYSSYSDEVWAASAGRDYTEIISGDPGQPRIALTFDAGTSSVKYGILQLLRDYNVRCTFFVTGVIAEITPNYWIEATNDGHQVSNHSYDHPPFPDITDEEIQTQLAMADQIIYSLTGNRSRPLFRAPYGSRDARVLAAAEAVGYRHVFWSLDSGDIGAGSAQAIIDQVLNNVANGDVILFHCTQSTTDTSLVTIVPELLARGYELVTVSELVAPAEVESPPGTVAAGWSLVSFPAEPAHATPQTVFKGGPIDTNLLKWENQTQSLATYDAWSPTAFGPISADEGYWLQTTAPGTLKCAGRLQTTPRHIMLPHTLPDPGNAWTIIGYPFETPQSWSNCTIYNPNAVPDTGSVQEARDAGWISSLLYGWDSATQSLMDVGLPDDWPTSTEIEPWHGYWLVSKVNDLQLVIPPPP